MLLVSRFNATGITPASSTVQGSSEESKTEPLQPTDKIELAQTELVVVNPSEEVVSAEQAMPSQSQPGYQTACQNMKGMYTGERDTKLQAEASRFDNMKQDIINKYNREGKSFSIAQKAAQLREAARHEGVLKQISDQYEKQLKNLSC